MSKAPKTTQAIRDLFLVGNPPRTAQAPRSAQTSKRQASRGRQKPSVPPGSQDQMHFRRSS